MNRIIVNWMYPRSLTTVFMRAITNRGDFHTIFEPTLPLYWRNRNEPGVQSHQDYEGWPVVYEEVIRKIYGIAEKSPTFIKECPYHAIDHYLADEAYLRRCTHMFQIRNPKYVVLSFWKVIGSQRSMRIEDVGPVASDRISTGSANWACTPWTTARPRWSLTATTSRTTRPGSWPPGATPWGWNSSPKPCAGRRNGGLNTTTARISTMT